MTRPRPTSRLLRTGATSLAVLAAGAAGAHAAASVDFGAASKTPSSARAAQAPFPRAAGTAPGAGRPSRVTMRNDASAPVDLLLHIGHPAGADADAELCQALELAIRDRVTGRTVRTLTVAAGRPARIARLAPGETVRYEAEIRFVPPRGRGAGDRAQGATCAVDFAWSFAADV